MVFGPATDVLLHREARRGADREGCAPLLPPKTRDWDLLRTQAEDDFFNSRMKSDRQWVGFNPTSRWTWSAAPSTPWENAPSPFTQPPKYSCSRTRHDSEIKGSRFLVAKIR